MANFIAPLLSPFDHEAKDPASEFRYWGRLLMIFAILIK